MFGVSQDVAGRQLRQANKAQLKRLQGRTNDGGTQDQAQPEDAAAADQEDAAIEKDLVQIKEERLKRIQALPSSVWT